LLDGTLRFGWARAGTDGGVAPELGGDAVAEGLIGMHAGA